MKQGETVEQFLQRCRMFFFPTRLAPRSQSLFTPHRAMATHRYTSLYCGEIGMRRGFCWKLVLISMQKAI